MFWQSNPVKSCTVDGPRKYTVCGKCMGFNNSFDTRMRFRKGHKADNIFFIKCMPVCIKYALNLFCDIRSKPMIDACRNYNEISFILPCIVIHCSVAFVHFPLCCIGCYGCNIVNTTNDAFALHTP